MARPKKDKGQARHKFLQVRLQRREYTAFREAAEKAGLDLSSWARERLKKAARKEKREGD